jgi:hypothetical protein
MSSPRTPDRLPPTGFHLANARIGIDVVVRAEFVKVGRPVGVLSGFRFAMRQNGLRHEVAFLESDGEYDYLLMVQASDDFDATSRSVLNSELPIDREALQVLGEIGERGRLHLWCGDKPPLEFEQTYRQCPPRAA